MNQKIFLRRLAQIAAGLAVGAGFALSAAPAMAHDNVNWSVTVGSPAVISPQPQFIYTQPSFLYPPPPATVVQYRDDGWRREHEWREHERREHEWREHERREHEWRERRGRHEPEGWRWHRN